MSQDHLFQQLKHPNPHLRERAILELAETRNETTIPRLMSFLGEQDFNYRWAVIKALGVIGEDAAVALAEPLLNSDNATIRSSCASALAQIASNHPKIPFPAQGLQGLKSALNDPNPLVSLASVNALGEIGVPALDILIESLQTIDNPASAVAIVNALATIGDSRGVDILTALVNDESADSYVRESATSALSRLELVRKNNRGTQ